MKHPSVQTIMIGMVATAAIGVTAIWGNSLAQEVEPSPLSTLKGVPLPLPNNLDSVVKYDAGESEHAKKYKAIIALGKALFWDRQVGSDGQSCASCHFHAGADNRTKNQVNPGFRAFVQDLAATTFQNTQTGGPSGPNYQLRKGDFPLHLLQNPEDRNSTILFSTNHDTNKDVVSSQGTYGGTFSGFFGINSEQCTPDTNSPFHVNQKLTRKVEPRNTPTTINAIFQFRTFWDGRANNRFNGVDPFGRRNVNAKVLVNNGGSVVQDTLDMNNAALASQAAGPPGSDLEMACSGRAFKLIGRKLLTGIPRPLFGQKVAADDSVLGSYADAGHGLKAPWTYTKLIQDAFQEKYWNGGSYVSLDGFTMMEENFSLYFALAVMMYESTLVSDESPFDSYMLGDHSALTESQKRGLDLFTDKGKCSNCHKGPDLTGAGFVLQKENQEGGLVERMEMAANGVALYDNGFYNIGVTPTSHDLGVGEKDPWNNPLSFTRQFKNNPFNPGPDPFQVDTCTFEADPCISKSQIGQDSRDAVDGAFKTPGLRNIALTGPYMHNGGMSTLKQVVEFYNRGGNRRGPDGNDTTGFGNNPSNLDPDITRLELTEQEQADLVAFLESLTDERVRCEKAPFDHPALAIVNGHSSVDANGDGRLEDVIRRLPAVGKNGLAANVCLKPFEATLPN